MRKKLKDTFLAHRGNDHRPHLFRKNGLLVVFTLILALELSLLGGALVLPKIMPQWGAVFPGVLTALSNEERVENNLGELKVNPVLEKAAQAKAEEMARLGYFAHQSPDGRMAWNWMTDFGYVYQYAGENLAVNFVDSREVVDAWMDSPTHRDNILKGAYTETGIGMATGVYKGAEAVFVVQFFGKPLILVPTPRHPETVDVLSKDPEPVSEENSVVLGAETRNISTSNLLKKVASSPRTYGTYALSVFALLIFGVLIVNWTHHHPHSLAHGVLAVGVLAGIIYMNKNLIFPQLTLPPDAQNAAVVSAF